MTEAHQEILRDVTIRTTTHKKGKYRKTMNHGAHFTSTCPISCRQRSAIHGFNDHKPEVQFIFRFDSHTLARDHALIFTIPMATGRTFGRTMYTGEKVTEIPLPWITANVRASHPQFDLGS